ncbi:hypothetical protein [Thermocatellispora tengchongensis]|uniref:hypothetical protein n=1 Tax=Thermocatellispora tengchongensis TaxID=1073253 RepID=UPI00363809AF
MTMLSDDQQAMVRAPFARQAGRAERVGVEVEAGVVDPRTGVSRPYHGERGVGALLELIMSRWGGAPVRQGGTSSGSSAPTEWRSRWSRGARWSTPRRPTAAWRGWWTG